LRILINDFAGHPFQLQLSRELARQQHEVLHLYFGDNNTPMGATRRLPTDTKFLDIRAIHLSSEFRKHSILKRRGYDLAYGRTAAQHLIKFRPDVVLSANTPLDAQALLAEASRKVEAKFVFWLQDIYSFAVRFVLRRRGIPMSSLIARYYENFERKLLLRSDAIVCIAPEFCSTLQSWSVDPGRIKVIENWAPLNEMEPIEQVNPWSVQHGLDGKFCFLYSGTLGMKHRPELLLQLAREFQSDAEVRIVVVASGAGAEWLRSEMAKSPLHNLKIFPLQDYNAVPQVLATGSVLLSILDDDCGVFCVPSKTLAYLCARRPLLLASPEGNLSNSLIQRSGGGIAVPSTDPRGYIESARLLRHDPDLRERYAVAGHAYAQRTFEITSIAKRFTDLFESLSRGRISEPSFVGVDS
jgi:glycosyltransferase involved in cell wall biosynthesis